VQIAQRTVAARREGFGQPLEWARKLDSERPSIREKRMSGPSSRSYTQKLWMRVKRKAAYLPG